MSLNEDFIGTEPNSYNLNTSIVGVGRQFGSITNSQYNLSTSSDLVFHEINKMQFIVN